jgi:hypothetical protein
MTGAEILLEAKKAKKAGRNLLAQRREREFAAADSFSEAFGETRGGVFAIGGNQFVDRGEERDLREAIAVDALKPRFFPGFGKIGERRFTLVFRAGRDSVGEGIWLV